MRINNTEGILRVYQLSNNNTKNVKKANVDKNDDVKFSKQAIDVQYGLKKLKEQTAEDSERAKRVEELKRQVQNGTYNVSGEMIADKMLSDMNFNKLV